MIAVWWPAVCLIHYSFLNPGEAITSEKYAQRIDESYNACSRHWSTERAQFFSRTREKGPILLWPHATQPVLQKLNKLGYEVLPHLPYSPDLSSMNYCFFKHLDNFLQGKCFLSQQEAENAFQGFTRQINLFLIGKNVLTVMVPILNNKSVFEPSYDDLKFTVWNHNYFFTNVNIMPLSQRDLGVSPASVWTYSIDAKPSLLSTEVLCRFYICRWQKLSQLSSFKFWFTFSSHILCAKLRETLESLYWWFQVTISWKLENTS